MVVADFPGSNLDKGWLLDIKAKEITSKLGEMWKALSDEEKEIYVARFKESHKQYISQMQEWREQHPESKTRAEIKRERKQRLQIPEEFVSEKMDDLVGTNVLWIWEAGMSDSRIKKEIKSMWENLDEKERKKYLTKASKSAPKQKSSRALSPYNFFCRLYRAEILKENPGYCRWIG